MNGVGTDIGQAHHLKQGEGLATTFDQGDLLKYAYLYGQRREAKAAEVEAKKNGALKSIMSYNPEYFIKHDGELHGEVDKVINDGADLITKYNIGDPWTSQDPKAVEWRKNYVRTDQMAKMSKQVKDQWSKYQDDINKAGADDFDPKTLVAVHDYFEKPLASIVDESILPPNLIKKYAYTDTFDLINKNFSAWEHKSGAPPTDAEVLDFTRALVTEPANAEKAAKSYGAKWSQMSEPERQDIATRAQALGLENYIVMAYDDAKRVQARAKPFDAVTELTKMADQLNVETVESSGPEGSSTVVNEKRLQQKIEAVVRNGFSSRQEWMTHYSDQLPRYKDETDGAYATRIRQQMRTDLNVLAEKNKKSAVTEKGKDRKEFEANRNQWIVDMRSNDQKANWAASQWLTGGKVFQNMEVEYSNIGTENGQKFVEMTLKTPMSVKEVTDTVDMGNGIVKEQDVMEQVDGTKKVRFEFSNDGIANQYFASLYDKVYNSRGKANYDAKLTERTIRSAADLVNPIPAPAAGTHNSLFPPKQ